MPEIKLDQVPDVIGKGMRTFYTFENKGQVILPGAYIYMGLDLKKIYLDCIWAASGWGKTASTAEEVHAMGLFAFGTMYHEQPWIVLGGDVEQNKVRNMVMNCTDPLAFQELDYDIMRTNDRAQTAIKINTPIMGAWRIGHGRRIGVMTNAQSKAYQLAPGYHDDCLKLLEATIERLIDEPRAWIKDHTISPDGAVTAKGREVNYNDPRAKRWTLFGLLSIVSEGIRAQGHLHNTPLSVVKELLLFEGWYRLPGPTPDKPGPKKWKMLAEEGYAGSPKMLIRYLERVREELEANKREQGHDSDLPD